MSRRQMLLLVVLSSWGWAGCEDRLPPTPQITAVHPAWIPSGSEIWLTIQGTGFEPKVVFDPRSSDIAVDEDFSVSVNGVPASEIRRTSAGTLAVRFPAIEASSTALSLTVETPFGTRAEAAGLACIGEGEERLVQLCVGQGLQLMLCEAPTAGGTVTPLVAVAPHSHLPYFVSTLDGSVLATYEAVSETELRLVLVWPDRPGEILPVTEAAAWRTKLPDGGYESLHGGRLPFDLGAFTPEGDALVFLAGHRELRIASVPRSPTDGPVRIRTRYVLPASKQGILDDLDIDPTGRYVLASYVRAPDPQGWLSLEGRSLFLLALEGQSEPIALLDDPDHSDGPAVFLPGADRILFVSDRTGIEVPVEGPDKKWKMVGLQGLFTLDLKTLEVEPLTSSWIMVFMGAPMVSADGYWAALPGYLADTRKSGPDDLLLVHLEDGAVYRALADAGHECTSLSEGGCPSGELGLQFSRDGRRLLFLSARYVPGEHSSEESEFRTVELRLPTEEELPRVEGGMESGDRTLPLTYLRFMDDTVGLGYRTRFSPCR
ncbi:MAG: hypothetical protein D6729_06810 [Deltaproteobacteria bacterium]|nr:MAG: hypothetical protein D6729_06810 [Deltaproteobacteria bacterium]